MPNRESIELTVTKVRYYLWANAYLVEAEEGNGRLSHLSWYVDAEIHPKLKVGDTILMYVNWR